MFFRESKQLAADHPALESSVQKLDELLASQSYTAVLIPNVLAAALALQENRIETLLNLYVGAGLLCSEHAYVSYCCDVFVQKNQSSTRLRCTDCGRRLPKDCEKAFLFYFSKSARERIEQRQPISSLIIHQNYTKATLRKLIKSLLPGDQLDAFLCDCFSDVSGDISSGMGATQKITLLFSYHDLSEIVPAMQKYLKRTLPG